jgi:hypothetical protein
MPNFVATLELLSLSGSLANDSLTPELVVQDHDNDDLLLTLASLPLNLGGIAFVVAALQLKALADAAGVCICRPSWSLWHQAAMAQLDPLFDCSAFFEFNDDHGLNAVADNSIPSDFDTPTTIF